MLMPPFVVIWIWLCAWLNCAGWTLSWLHQLNAGGYAVALALGLAGLLVWHRRTGVPLMPAIHWPKLRRRFRRGFPLAFLILASMAFIGGATHPANNWDTLAYRTPRVLHWLADQQWHWIYSKFPRLNTRTVGFEWLTAPVMLFTGTDRFIFLINVICFLLLPGRIFALFTRLGVRPRAAWHWMWLFPSGYGYVLQAGAVVNDMCGAFMTLTAVEFALRARRAMKISDLWTSGLAAMLMVSVKAFNLVLLLPWLIAVWPALKLSWRRPLATLAVVLLALGASMLPTALANIIYAGDWTAKSIDKVGGGDAKVLLLANALNQPIANLAPPVFPFRIQWENFVQRHTPARLGEEMRANTEGGLAKFQIPDRGIRWPRLRPLAAAFVFARKKIPRPRIFHARPFPAWNTGFLGRLGGCIYFNGEGGLLWAGALSPAVLSAACAASADGGGFRQGFSSARLAQRSLSHLRCSGFAACAVSATPFVACGFASASAGRGALAHFSHPSRLCRVSCLRRACRRVGGGARGSAAGCQPSGFYRRRPAGDVALATIRIASGIEH